MLKIAISGKMCSGKTTSAKFVQKCIAEYGYIAYIMSFATKIKLLAKDLFYDKGDGHKDRKLLQDLGQKLKEIRDTVWIDYLVGKIRKCSNPVIIDDVRFRDEFDSLKREGFTLIRLEVDQDVQEQRLVELYPDNYKEHLERRSNVSETDLDQYIVNFDYVLNSGDTELLNKCLKQVVSELINR